MERRSSSDPNPSMPVRYLMLPTIDCCRLFSDAVCMINSVRIASMDCASRYAASSSPLEPYIPDFCCTHALPERGMGLSALLMMTYDLKTFS